MKTTLRFLSLNDQASWHRQVEEQLNHLHSLTAITAAEVVLEHQIDTAPPFHVKARLEVPGHGVHVKETRHTREAALLVHGPDLKAEVSGDTLEAALLKASRDPGHRVKTRQVRHKERGKSQLQLSAVSGRQTRFPSGQMK